MTPDEVARLLRVQPKTVLQWLASGKLKGKQIGPKKLWRVSRAAVQDFSGYAFLRTSNEQRQAG